MRRDQYLLAWILAFLALGALGFSQTSIYDKPPNSRATREGSQTLRGYRLSPDARRISGTGSRSGQILLRLPAMPRKAGPGLLGILHHGTDVEVFLGWMDPEMKADGFEHHVEVFRGRRGTMAALVHDFTLVGGPSRAVRLFQAPHAQGAPTVLIDIQGGAYWTTTYILAPDRRSIALEFASTDYEFADLNRDGNYELIAWGRRPHDVRCHFGIFGVRYYPQVFVRDAEGYRRAWPPPDWPPTDGQILERFRNREKEGVPWGANIQVVAGFADLDSDGTAKLIVLQDRLLGEPAQSLAVYRLEGKQFRLVAQTPLPPEQIAYLLGDVRDSAGGKEILIQTATHAKCEAGGDPSASGTAEMSYFWRGGQLQLAAPKR